MSPISSPSGAAANLQEHDLQDRDTPGSERLQRALQRGAKFLPVQAALEVFVHNNLLLAFQDQPFHEAIEQARRKLGARGYLPEASYRQALISGRIRVEDLDAVLADEGLSDALIAPRFPGRAAATRLVLCHGVHVETIAHLRWALVEKDAANRFGGDVPASARAAIERDTRTWLEEQVTASGPEGAREVARRIVSPTPGVRSQDPLAKLGALLGRTSLPTDLRAAFDADPELMSVRALWTACVRACEHLEGEPAGDEEPARFFRDLLLATSGDDPALLIHEQLIPLCGSFLDRGQSHWSMPDRNRGFFRAWLEVATAGVGARPAWLHPLDRRLALWKARDVSAEDAALEVLDELGVGDDELDDFVAHTLLLLPGWAGMFARLASAPTPLGRSPAVVRLVDFLAVRLTLDLYAYRHFAERLGLDVPASRIRAECRLLPRIAEPKVRGRHDTAWPLFRLCQLAGLAAPAVWALERGDVAALLRFFDDLDEPTRLRLFHEAYERRYRVELLEGVAANLAAPMASPTERPTMQVFLCLDDRFESSRRHLEEIDPRCETFGVAGFFGLAIAYQGIDDPSTFPLCPVIVSPRHRVEEQALTRQFNVAELRAQRRRRLGQLEAAFNRASRSLVLGPLVTGVSGLLAALPLLANVFAPRAAHQIRKAVERWWLPEPLTRLTALRAEETGSTTEELMMGFTVEEMTARVASFFENTGLVDRFAPIVLALGHDSSSVNNPLFPAYSCAACGGRSGGPNGRLFARMANDPRIREGLAARGIRVPDDTVFVGGLYDTTTEAIQLYDADLIPDAVRPALAHALAVMQEMSRRDAHERCRRFDLAPRGLTAARALKHVERRAVDLSEARPELGHAGNAACVVGRRSRTQGLFMDRRSFLVSYDPTIDPEGRILERVLAAISPVGAGISLDYYFSTVDPERLGSGTKLPHNVTGLFGVMNGACSDLRTGLPRQATELHEPVRLHMIVEATPRILTAVCDRQPSVAELVLNEWVRVIALDPKTDEMWLFDRRFGFRRHQPAVVALPRVPVSRDWYDGRSGPVPPALIRPLPGGR